MEVNNLPIAEAPKSASEAVRPKEVKAPVSQRQDREEMGRSIVGEVAKLSAEHPEVDLRAEVEEINALERKLSELPDDQKKVDSSAPGNPRKKSPQELAAQVMSVHGLGLGSKTSESGVNLDQAYKEGRKEISELLGQGASEEVLRTKLDELYRQGFNLGIYSAAQGPGSEERIAEEMQRYLKHDYSEDEARREAIKALSRDGYLSALRSWRREHERSIKENFEAPIANRPLDEQVEKTRIEELRDKVIVIDGPERPDLGTDFPGGNFLYHGTKVEQAISIVNSGALLSGRALIERANQEALARGEEPNIVARNSGYEGISWNFNNITAMPGERYHLVGFLTSPNAVLTPDTQLAIPSRPAPNELILLNGAIDSSSYYIAKSQQELASAFGAGETNSVLSNMISLSTARGMESEGKKASIEPQLRDFTSKDMSDEQMAEFLRSKFTVGSNGSVELSVDLLQQIDNGIPVAAVWFQSLVDTGKIKDIPGFEDCATVREIVSRFGTDSGKSFYPALRSFEGEFKKRTEAAEKLPGEIGVPVSDMYMMVPDTDLEKWLRVLARSEASPRGILVFNHNSVRMENFASDHRGDDDAMTAEIRKVVPKSEGLIDFEADLLGEEITPDKLAGFKRHVIGERFLSKRKSLRKDRAGKVVIS